MRADFESLRAFPVTHTITEIGLPVGPPQET